MTPGAAGGAGRGRAEGRSFNVSGVAVVNSSCGARACAVWVHVDRGAAHYTCEVSSEGPRFAVDKRSAEMTLAGTRFFYISNSIFITGTRLMSAVLPEYDPLITNLPLVLLPGEDVLVNCTADYSLPPADISWFLDDEPVTGGSVRALQSLYGAFRACIKITIYLNAGTG
ncbi:hypothetical protein EVAR_44006_1 [Eumeta japonica]|uniref:Ig-like domain-containing protein n=1 Tax=Eumeta variegata TaxID=151549 RepID=A0A4C1XH49_EUMVA|nr:hypothetical protein EVAR_44006_1 [Eumeta japonica]